MRIPQWFILAWVVGIGVLSIVAAVVTYGFVRDRAAELDSVLELPDLPQIGACRKSARKGAIQARRTRPQPPPAKRTKRQSPATRPQRMRERRILSTRHPTAPTRQMTASLPMRPGTTRAACRCC